MKDRSLRECQTEQGKKVFTHWWKTVIEGDGWMSLGRAFHNLRSMTSTAFPWVAAYLALEYWGTQIKASEILFIGKGGNKTPITAVLSAWIFFPKKCGPKSHSILMCLVVYGIMINCVMVINFSWKMYELRFFSHSWRMKLTQETLNCCKRGGSNVPKNIY